MDTIYVKTHIRKQIKNNKKLYKASLLTEDKKQEKIIGWFITRSEATQIVNMAKERHEKMRLIRTKGDVEMAATKTNLTAKYDQNDAITISMNNNYNEVGNNLQQNHDKNEVTIMDEKMKLDAIEEKEVNTNKLDTKNAVDEPFAFYPIPNHLPKVDVKIKTPKYNLPLLPHPKKKIGSHIKKGATETLLPSMMKGKANGFKILSRRKQRGGRKIDDTEDIKMLVSPQPYVEPFYSKLDIEKDNMYLRTPHTAGFHTLSTTMYPTNSAEDQFGSRVDSSDDGSFVNKDTIKMAIDCNESKPTMKKYHNNKKHIETVHNRLNNSSSYTGIYRRLNYYDANLSSQKLNNNNTNNLNKKRKRIALSPSASRLEYARQRNKIWKAEDATSHEILQNKLRAAGSSIEYNITDSHGSKGERSNRQMVIAPINLSILTTKKPLLNRSHGSKMYLKNTWY